MKRIDFLNLSLIIVIIYYLFKNKDIIEGNEESGGTKCSHLETCRSYPYEYKSGGDTLGQDQCLDGSVNCDENEKIIRCCQNKTEISSDLITSTGTFNFTFLKQFPSDFQFLLMS